MTREYRLVAVVLTLNEARNISDCLECLEFADQVLVLDSFSEDGTPEIARACGARLEQRPFVDYADQRNFALDMLREKADYVLFVDADERVSPALAGEIRASLAAKPGAAVWRIPRHNMIFGRLTLGAGWYPDYQTRLLRTGAARYDPARPIHEVVIASGECGTLQEPLLHHNYDNLDQFRSKQRDYSERAARMRHAQGERPTLRFQLMQPLHHFRWRFLEQGGYREGWHGLRLCVLMAWYEFCVIRRLRELGRQG